MEKIIILNTAILTSEGMYTLRTISTEQAQKLVRENEFISAVGHQVAAEMLTKILGVNVPYNRIDSRLAKGQTALVFKLNSRPPEGKILSEEEVKAIGYHFQLLIRVDEEKVLSMYASMTESYFFVQADLEFELGNGSSSELEAGAKTSANEYIEEFKELLNIT